MLTLILLSQGAKEFNPVMEYYIGHGVGVFILVKYGLTAVPILFMLLAKERIANLYPIKIERLLYIFIAIFCLVILWELYLIFN